MAEGELEIQHVLAPAEHEAEEAVEHPTDDLNRSVGRLEAEADHAGDTLEEHEERIGNVEDDKQWITGEIEGLRRTLSETVQGIATEVNSLGERLSKLEEHPVSSVESVTEPPPEAKTEPPKRHGLLHRLI